MPLDLILTFPVPSLINQFNKILDMSSFHICMRVMILPFENEALFTLGENRKQNTVSIYHTSSNEIHLTHSEKKKPHHLKGACICLEIR